MLKQMATLFSHERDGTPLSRLIFFGLSLIYLVSRMTAAIGQAQNIFQFDKRGFFLRSIGDPLLLVVACALILIGRFATISVAMVIAGFVFYVSGYRGLIGVAHAHGLAALSIGSVRAWFENTPTNLIIQTLFALTIFIFAAFQGFQLWRRRR